MKLNLHFNKIKEYLELNTTLNIYALFKEKSLSEIFSIYLTVRKIKEKYPEKIVMFFSSDLKNHKPIQECSYYLVSDNEIMKMNKAHLINSKQKVVSIIPNPIQFQKARNAIGNNIPLNRLCATIIDDSQEKELEYLLPKEIEGMYGIEEYSHQELLDKGIFLDEEWKPSERYPDRFTMINEILVATKTINNAPTVEELLKLTKEELVNKYKLIRYHQLTVKKQKRLGK